MAISRELHFNFMGIMLIFKVGCGSQEGWVEGGTETAVFNRTPLFSDGQVI